MVVDGDLVIYGRLRKGNKMISHPFYTAVGFVGAHVSFDNGNGVGEIFFCGGWESELAGKVLVKEILLEGAVV